MTDTVLDQRSSSTVPPAAAPPPPQPTRRPRVREVSSRFMSPVPSTPHPSANNNRQQQQQQQQRSTSASRQRRHPDLEFANDENNKPNARAVVKLFKDNNNNNNTSINNNYEQQLTSRYRPDTPTVPASSAKLRGMHHRSLSRDNLHHHQSAAAKLLQYTGIGNTKSLQSDSDSDTSSTASSSCSSTLVRNSSTRSLPEVRSSMPESDISSGRFLSEKNSNVRGIASGFDSSASNGNKFNCPNTPSSPCSRSLDLPRSHFQSLKAVDAKPPRQHQSLKMGGGLPLPPPPPLPNSKMAAPTAQDVRKGKKGSGHQEDIHSLRLLHNHYLQWRFANAKAQSSIQAQTKEIEKTLYSMGLKMEELYQSVKRKRIELAFLRRIKTLSAIIEPQMSYLDNWSTLEEDYSASLSEAVQALLNASLQLPLSGNVRADTQEIGEALNSAVKLMQSISNHLQSFMPKAEKAEVYISELARMVGVERALVEECGDLLSVTHKSQVEECSSQVQLIQLHRYIHG